MRRNIKLTIEYDGTNYSGWQSQNGHQNTVQETITQAIETITGERVVLYGASRTDAGVHAVGQVANFFSATYLSPTRLRAALNANLPRDIVVRRVVVAPPDFNARFFAKAKTYYYTIINGSVPSALQRHRIWFIPGRRLDIKAMRQAGRYLVGKHNFRAFATESGQEKNYVRTVYSLNIQLSKDGLVRIKIRANGFLYNMVRTIVGTLVRVGKNKIPPAEVKQIITSADRKKAGPTAPPQGLCLMKVEY